MIGKTISHYKIIEKLGEGGMGVVYKAEDTKLKRTVALKFLPHELTRDPEAKARFIREARAASALDHPNICTIHEIDETDDGKLFIVMACYEGKILKDKIKDQRLKIKETVNIAIQIGQGLAKAHEKGIIHRDIKPANIFITHDGTVKILDFGLAKLAGQAPLTKDTSTLGTVAYMSPEQCSGAGVDHRTDIWALGVVLYEILTGELPFQGEYDQAIMYAIVNQNHKPVLTLNKNIPPVLESALNIALNKDKQHRFSNASDFVESLQKVQLEIISGKFGPHIKRHLHTATASMKHLMLMLVLTLLIMSTGYLVIKNLFRGEQTEKAIAVLPFKNLTANDSLDIWENGIQELIISDLSTSKELRVMDSQVLSNLLNNLNPKEMNQSGLSIAGMVSARVNVESIVLGNILMAGENIRLQVKIQDSKTHQVVKSLIVDASKPDDFFHMADSIAVGIRNYLEIQSLKANEGYYSRNIAQTNSAEAYRNYLLGIKAIKAYEYQSAQKFLTRAVKIDSNFTAAYIDLSNAYRNSRDLDQAKHWHDKAYSKIKDLTYKNQLLLEVQRANLTKDPYASIKWSKKLAELEPQIRSTWYHLGLSYLKIEQYEQAIHSFRKAIGLAEQWHTGWAPFYRALGISYNKLEKYQEAKGTYLDGLEHFPEDPYLLRDMAIVSHTLKDTSEAQYYIKKLNNVAVEQGWREATLNGLLSKIYRDAAVNLFTRKDSVLATICLNRYQSIQEAQGRSKAIILRDIALCYYNAGNLEKSINLLNKALAINPAYSSALNNLAYILINYDINVEEGMKHVQKAIESDPDNYLYLDTQGLGYLKQGRFEQAAQVLQIAKDLSPNYHHEVHQHLQKALANLN